MSAFSDFFLGTPGRIQQFPTGTQQQQDVLQSILGQITTPMSQGIGNLQSILEGGRGAFEREERPALRQFQQEIVPNIAERFAGMGGLSSSGFQQTLAQQASSLAENLAARRAQRQSEAMGQLMQLLGVGMTPQFQYQQIPGTQGALSGLFGGIGTGLGTGFGGGLGRLLGIR